MLAIIVFVATTAAEAPKLPQCPPGQVLSCITIGEPNDRNVKCSCVAGQNPPQGTCAMQLSWVGGKPPDGSSPETHPGSKLPPCPTPKKAP